MVIEIRSLGGKHSSGPVVRQGVLVKQQDSRDQELPPAACPLPLGPGGPPTAPSQTMTLLRSAQFHARTCSLTWTPEQAVLRA